MIPERSRSQTDFSPVPRPGAGVLLTSSALGFAFSAPVAGAVFDHAWRPSPRAQAVSFNLGLVQSLSGDGPLEPKIRINGQLTPMSGENGRSAVALPLDASIANGDAESFAVLEVEPDADGELVKESRIEIIHSLTTISRTKEVGRKAIAQITWKGRSVVRIRPLVHFHLTYERIVPTSGGGLPRHLFL